jgi:hypothetical protein
VQYESVGHEESVQMRTRLVCTVTLVVGAVALALAGQQSVGKLSPEDYIEIEQLYARYNHLIDSGDAEGYASLFTPDGSFNANKGHDALVQFIRNRNAPNLRHWNTNLVITPTAEGARGAVYLMFLNVAGRPAAVGNAGKYEDTLVKTPQGWRFKTRVNRIEGEAPTSPTPTTPNPR